MDISSQDNNLIDIAAWLQHMPVDTLEDGATIMFAMTVPPSVPQPDQVVLAQASNTRANQKFDYVLNACQEVEQEGAGRAGALNVLVPDSKLSQGIRSYLRDSNVSSEGIEPTVKLLQDAIKGKLLKIEYVKQEIRGGHRLESFIFMENDGSLPSVPPDTSEVRYLKETSAVYYYRPEPDYSGKDQAVFSAEYKGKRYKIVLNILVQEMIAQSDAPSPCPAPVLTKIRKDGAIRPNRSDYGDSFYRYAGIEFNVGLLPGSTLAQTTAQTITLDPTAVGYGWFVDNTPQDNSEFLPTSTPNQWIAKAGSEAAGNR